MANSNPEKVCLSRAAPDEQLWVVPWVVCAIKNAETRMNAEIVDFKTKAD